MLTRGEARGDHFAVRLMGEADLAALAAFFAEVERREPLDAGRSLAGVTAWWHAPGRDSRAHLAVAAGPGGGEGRLLGYLEAAAPSPSGRARGHLLVHPDARGQGIGRALYTRFEQDVLPRQPAVLTFSPPQGAHLLRAFLERRGYAAERAFWQMRLPAEVTVALAPLAAGVTLRTFVPGQDEPLLMAIRNATFAGHYDYTPRTLAEIVYQTTQPHVRPEGILFAFYGGEIAGFCRAEVLPDDPARPGDAVGIIQNVGVLPAYRRLGLGRALLSRGVAYLRGQVSLVDLYVEGENAGALALYESLGFIRHHGRINMIKAIP